jgi:hypothetical protein
MMGENPGDRGGRFDGQFRLQRVARHKGYIREKYGLSYIPDSIPAAAAGERERERERKERPSFRFLPLRFTSCTCESEPKF